MTGKKLAEIIGVSESTISMVINNKPGISKKRRAEILEKIEKLNCDDILKKKVTLDHNIGFVVYKRHGEVVSKAPFSQLLIESISSALKESGYNLLFFQFDKNNSEHSLQQMIESDCCGFIIFAVEIFEDDLEILKSMEQPFVVVDNIFDAEHFDVVCVNSHLGIKKSLDYLKSFGHKEIGYIKSKIEINSFSERIAAFYDIMRASNLTVDENYIFELCYSDIDAYNDMKNYLLSGRKLPTALLSDNDFLANAAIRAIQDCGYNVPEDVSVIGFDDRPICLKSNPKITTISIPKDLIGINSVRLLIEKINKQRKETLKISVGVDIIIRESVSKPREIF